MSKSKPQVNVTLQLPQGVALMPDGRPLPDICTADQVLAYLQLGQGDNPGGKTPIRALNKLREKGWLVGFRCGRDVKFTRDAILACVKRMQEEVPL